jgi:hypothetical protein
VAEPPSVGDRHHRVNGRVSGLKIAMRSLQAHPSQIPERRGTEMAAKFVLNSAGGDANRRRDVGQSDVEVGIVVNELDCLAQRLRLRGKRFGIVPH